MYSKSVNAGLTFSQLVPIDTTNPPRQVGTRVVGRGPLMLAGYYLDGSMSPRIAVVSEDNGVSFSQPFVFGSNARGQGGTLANDDMFIYALYPVYDVTSFTGTVFDKFLDPGEPPLETANFDSLFWGDLALGPQSEKGAVFTRSGIHSVFFASKDFVTFVERGHAKGENILVLRVTPNPFNVSTSLFLQLSRQTDVSLAVFDILGRQIIDQTYKNLTSGEHRLHLFFTESPSGTYFARAMSDDDIVWTKLLQVK